MRLAQEEKNLGTRRYGDSSENIDRCQQFRTGAKRLLSTERHNSSPSSRFAPVLNVTVGYFHKSSLPPEFSDQLTQ